MNEIAAPMSSISTGRLNPNALPFRPNPRTNVFSAFQADAVARMNSATTPAFPTSTTQLNPNALPFQPNNSEVTTSNLVMLANIASQTNGGTPTSSTVGLNSIALPFLPNSNANDLITVILFTGFQNLTN